jgi:hypothetical protein
MSSPPLSYLLSVEIARYTGQDNYFGHKMANTKNLAASATEGQPRFDLVKDGAIVLFLAKYVGWEGLHVETANVIYVRDGYVGLVWLEGHSSRNEHIKMEELLSVHDKKGPHMKLSVFSGPGHILPAGKAWLEANPDKES